MADPSEHGVSIAIPTYNRAGLLGPTLQSVSRLEIPPGTQVEVLVIDNNCTDETPQVVDRAAAAGPIPVRRVLETRQGLCFGRNRGLEEARFDHVVYLDDDVEVAPDWLRGYFDAVERFGADCVVGPVTPRFDGQVPAYFTQRVLDSVGSPYSRKGSQPMLLPGELAHEIPGCNFAVRRQVATEIGGFDNRLDRVGKGLLAGGDWEFGRRLARAGKRVAYHPGCAIVHVITAEKLTRSYMRRRWYGVGATERAMQVFLDGRASRNNGVRRLRRALRLAARSGWARLTGRRALAFQREVEAFRELGYLVSSRASAELGGDAASRQSENGRASRVRIQ
jgi:GT2 family glycosyltransferase